MTSVTLANIEELVSKPQVVSISISGTLEGVDLIDPPLTANQFAAVTHEKVQEYTGAIHVDDDASAFLAVFDSQTVQDIAFEAEQLKLIDPSATLPSFSANLTSANPREAGLAASLGEQAEALGIEFGTITITMASNLPLESLQGLSVNEAAASLEAVNPANINDMTVTDTSEEILTNAALFEHGGILHQLAPNDVAAENVDRQDINEVASATNGDGPLIGSIKLSETGDLASPVDVETALNLLDVRVTNKPPAASLSIEDSADSVIAARY